jgi:malate dehydrogenase
MTETIRIAVTGGAGQIAYSLLFRLAAGELFPKKKIALHLLERPDMLHLLEGVKMELQDAAFPLLEQVVIGSDPRKVFEGVKWAFLVGAKPRTEGMERSDLLKDNGKIFQEQAQALNDVADKDVHALVVGNPCNTNCLIAIHNAKKLKPSQFSAMMRLDQNRATFSLAAKAGCSVTQVQDMIIWGNHSTTQVPDFINAKIAGQSAVSVIKESEWLEKDFTKLVQNRGAEILKVRGKSSAASAASSAIDAMKALTMPGPLFSSAIHSATSSYGIDSDIVFSVPCIFEAIGRCKEVPGMRWDSFFDEKIRISERELIGERDMVRELL